MLKTAIMPEDDKIPAEQFSDPKSETSIQNSFKEVAFSRATSEFAKRLNDELCKLNKAMRSFPSIDCSNILNALKIPDFPQAKLQFQEALEEAKEKKAIREKADKKKKEAFINSLKEEYKNENVTLCVGAGLSMESKIPSWDSLVTDLYISLINEILKKDKYRLDDKDIKLIKKSLLESRELSNITQVRCLKTQTSVLDFHKSLLGILYKGHKGAKTPLLNSIVKMASPKFNHKGLKNIITYNFDDILETALSAKEVAFNITTEREKTASGKKLNISHVHGYLPRDIDDKGLGEANIIFSEEDYHRVYSDVYCWANILQINALRETTCLFVGCSLSDPNLRRLLESSKEKQPKHYAIMKTPSIASKEPLSKSMDLYLSTEKYMREKMFEDMGVNIIWVSDYKDIPSIIDELIKHASQ